jgi:hypothetical protein
MKIKTLLTFVSAVLLWSCGKEQVENAHPNNSPIDIYTSIGIDSKMAFAKVMAKAITNPEVKELLTNKAASQFDKDYDVLYHQVKNNLVGGRSLDEYIKDISSESDYKLFNRTPLLTVFIPNNLKYGLSNAKYSREATWVAVRNHENKLIAYNANGEVQELDEKKMPSIPVMVIKENERVIYENDTKKQFSKGEFIFESEGNSYFFSDNEFNGSKLAISQLQASIQPQERLVTDLRVIDSEVRTAYDHSLTCNTCPQRDWLYYGIYPVTGQNEGPMNIKYSEAITSLQFTNTNVFSTLGGWDEGNYELYVSIFFGGASTGVFSSMLKVISVSPNDMFTFNEDGGLTGNKQYLTSYAIVPWDMKAYGNRWAFKVEEYDPEVKKTATYAHSSTYGTNFKFDTSIPIAKEVKVGAEFGTTSSTQNSTNFTYETTDSNDILGGAILSWTDAVMVRVDSHTIFGHTFKTAFMGTINTGTTVIGVETIRTAP